MNTALDRYDDIGLISIPGNPYISIPKNINGKDLSLCLIEIGCRPEGKHSQLKNKRELLFRHFKTNQNEIYNVYRGLVYFNGNSDIVFNKDSRIHPRLRPDFSIHYNFIPKYLLGLDENDLDYLSNLAPKGAKKTIRSCLYDQDTDTLESIIKDTTLDDYSTFKGALAERLFFNEIRLSKKSLNIKLYTNAHLNVKNRSYRSGTEVDLVLAFYNDRMLRKLLGRINSKQHIYFSSKTGSYKVTS